MSFEDIRSIHVSSIYLGVESKSNSDYDRNITVNKLLDNRSENEEKENIDK